MKQSMDQSQLLQEDHWTFWSLTSSSAESAGIDNRRWILCQSNYDKRYTFRWKCFSVLFREVVKRILPSSISEERRGRYRKPRRYCFKDIGKIGYLQYLYLVAKRRLNVLNKMRWIWSFSIWLLSRNQYKVAINYPKQNIRKPWKIRQYWMYV